MSEQPADEPQPEASAPAGVRLVFQDGQVVPCDVFRDRGADRPASAAEPHGMTYWRAVPRGGEPPLGTYEVHFDEVPAHTGLWVDIPLVGPGLTSLAATEGAAQK